MIYTIADFGIAYGHMLKEKENSVTLAIKGIVSKCYKNSSPKPGIYELKKDEIVDSVSDVKYFGLDPYLGRVMKFENGLMSIENVKCPLPEGTNIEVRKLWSKDYAETLLLDIESDFNVSEFVKNYEENEGDSWGIFENGNLVGYTSMGYADCCGDEIDKDPFYTYDARLLSDVYIVPSHRKHGYARFMLGKILAQYMEDPIYLSYLYDELKGFYEKFGFESIGENYMRKL